MKNRILLVGGGTGGHIVPIYNIFAELKKRQSNSDVYVVGGGSEIEKNFFGKEKNYYSIKTGKLKRHDFFDNFWQLVLLLFGIIQSFFLLRRTKPSIIFSKGGYVSYPIIFWAQILKIPYCIHESDIEMGSANRYAARGAQKVFVGFPVRYYRGINSKKLVFSGQLIPAQEKDSAKYDFGFGKDKKIIFVTGGSLGANNLNKNVFALLPKLLENYNVVHQVGVKNYQTAIDVRAGLKESVKRSYFVRGFLGWDKNINLATSALAQADLVVSRAGATTIAEIARAQKPMILIPYPFASADHQYKNAKALKDLGAAALVDDGKLTPEILWQTITKVLEDPERIKTMTKHAFGYFPKNGIDRVCDELLIRSDK